LGGGEQVSKRRAALWAQDYLPEQAKLIEQALEWRKAQDDKGIKNRFSINQWLLPKNYGNLDKTV